MEQRAVICCFTFKGLEARAIHTELESVYGPEVLALLTGKKWRRPFHQGRMYLFDDPRSGSPLANDLAGTVSSVLKEKPFSSCRMLCRHFRIGKTMCLRILHDKLDLKMSICAGCRMPCRSTGRTK
jgi:hypothetical protein